MLNRCQVGVDVTQGAVDADVYDAGVYTSLGNCGLDGVLDAVHVLSASSANCASLDINTIFSLIHIFLFYEYQIKGFVAILCLLSTVEEIVKIDTYGYYVYILVMY